VLVAAALTAACLGVPVAASADPVGCLPPAPGMSGRFSGSGAVAKVCYDLDLPAGAVIARLDDQAWPLNTPPAVVVDANGVEQCGPIMAHQVDDPLCTLGGTAPYQLVVTTLGLPYDFTILRADTDEDCPALAETEFGVEEASDYSLDPGDYARCATVSGEDLGTVRVTFQTSTPGRTLEVVALGADAAVCAIGPSAYESRDCPAPTNGPGRYVVTMSVASDRPTDWRINWRSVGHASGCVPASSAWGQAAHGGSLGSGLEIDCIRVPATQPEDVNLGVLPQPDARLRLSGYGGTELSCWGWEGSCQVTGGESATYLVSALVPLATPTDYSVGVLQLFGASGANPDCTQVPPQQFGFGPVAAALSSDHPFACYVLTDSPLAHYAVEATPSTGVNSAVVQAFGGLTSYSTCYRSPVGLECYGVMSLVDDRTVSGVLVISRPAGVDAMDYQVQATCIDSCEPISLEPRLVPDLSASARVDDRLTAPRVVWSADPTSVAYQWLRDGVAIPGATGQHRRVVVDDLGHRLSVRMTPARQYTSPVPATSSSVAVSRGAAPKPTERPVVVGPTRVGRRVVATRGAWDRKPSGYRFRWYVGSRRVGSARSLLLRSAWVGEELHLEVTAARPGCANGRASSRTAMIRR
jgi:hypothetical protein